MDNISRITGEVIKTDDSKTINEQPENNMQFEAFKIVGELIKENDINRNSKSLNYLKQTWGFSEEIIKAVHDHFDGSFDESDHFLNILDGADDIDDAWLKYCDEVDCYEVNPFSGLEK